jgi:hypothetical protein
MDGDDAFSRAMRIAESLERLNTPYAVGGAIALGVWGVPRGTVDVDINVFVEPDLLGGVIEVLNALGIAIDATRAISESRDRGMFVGDWAGMRIDVFTPSIDFSYEALRTRKRCTVGGVDAWYLSAESIAIFKLLFFRSKDVADLERLVAVAELDARYVRRWIVEMMGEDDPRVVKWDEIVATFAHEKS